MLAGGISLLLWVLFIHVAGIYLFLRGFLLTRLALPHTTSCPDGSCVLPATHKRGVLLIIDALRFDFVTPDPPQELLSPFHHGVLTLPREVTQKQPHNSFLFNSYADPPTTTLQRIKGLTTGSLPTFVDIGSNFGGAVIDEDSLVNQLRAAGKNIAFMGDDTWLTTFPTEFQSNLSFPYDSFNVEDLHTVDEGVIAHLLPLLREDGPSKSWDFIIGHFLGVDHVGHRLGPDNPTMRAKLQQMNDVLTEVIDLLDDDTLLVVLGDHGMDRTGDHGGDGVLETSAGLWIYSKSRPLSSEKPSSSVPSTLFPESTFPGASRSHRTVQQIDILPTVSLLLGLPIPFNNLGTVIPELFTSTPDLLSRALEINVKQIHDFLAAYRVNAFSADLDEMWNTLRPLWKSISGAATSDGRLEAQYEFTRVALAGCRALWAQFDVTLMVMGLVLLSISVIATWVLFVMLRSVDVRLKWESWLVTRMVWASRGGLAGALVGAVAYLILGRIMGLEGFDALSPIIFAIASLSAICVIVSSRPKPSFPSFGSLYAAFPLVVHACAFFSNSFTIWEERVVLFLLATTLVVPVFHGLAAPTARLRTRIIAFSAVALVAARLIGWSTVCREELGPLCHITYFAGATLPAPPPLVLAMVIPVVIALPWVVRRVLHTSQSDNVVASLFLPWLFLSVLGLGAAYWVIEYLEAADIWEAWWVRDLRTVVARFAFAISLLGSGTLWYKLPVCLDVSSKSTVDTKNGKESTEVTILGFGNAFGAPYLVFWCILFSATWVATQLTGQLVLALMAILVIAHVEIVDSVRDVRALQTAFASSTPSVALSAGPPSQAASVQFVEIVPLALLSMLAFFGTGHQATVPSIQWKAAFMLTRTVVYPWSPFLVVLNSFGPQALLALAVPLLALWNVAPLDLRPQPPSTEAKSPPEPPTSRMLRETLRASLGMVLYYSVLLLSALGTAGYLRRHLMVWKVWAPRVGVAVFSWGIVSLAVLLGWSLGVKRVVGSKGVGGTLKRLGFSS